MDKKTIGYLEYLDTMQNYCEDKQKHNELSCQFLDVEFNKNEYLDLIAKRTTASASKALEILRKTKPTDDLSNWNTTLNDKIKPTLNICAGQYMSCKHSEPNLSNIKSFFEIYKKTVVKIPQSLPSAQRYPVGINSNTDNIEAGCEDKLVVNVGASNFSSTSNESSCTTRIQANLQNTSATVASSFQSKIATKAINTNVQTLIPKNTNQNDFKTARDIMEINMKKKNDKTNTNQPPLFDYGTSKKSLGTRRTGKSDFVPPIKQKEPNATGIPRKCEEKPLEDERLRNIDPKMIELITNEIMHKFKPICWEDIAGLEYAKSIIQEAVVWPILRPDIFTGLRRPPRGILLFGPPGTGKTLIGKCIASQSKSTFFSISASCLTSKWIGDGEKMVRALFAVAAINQPSVVFIDEIDSLLSQRSESEHESSRRIKTEFLVQLDGAATSEEERILIVGATNRPQELDEAARRRLVRRLYIPLPEQEARHQILRNLLRTVQNELSEEELVEVGRLTEGYTGADMESLCREASMEPIRSIPPQDIPFFDVNNVRPINIQDFHSALKRVKASVSQSDLAQYVAWNSTFGSGNTN